MAAAKKMDELLVAWLSSDATYESILGLLETYHTLQLAQAAAASEAADPAAGKGGAATADPHDDSRPPGGAKPSSGSGGGIPPFYPGGPAADPPRAHRRRRMGAGPATSPPLSPPETWDPSESAADGAVFVRDRACALYREVGHDPPLLSPASVTGDDEDGGGPAAGGSFSGTGATTNALSRKYLLPEQFARVAKDICRFPSFAGVPLYRRILDLWNTRTAGRQAPMEVVTLEMLEWFWRTELEPHDALDRFFRLVKQPGRDYIGRDDFLPFVRALLRDHPGLEFLASHAEFQEKYALTVVARIFYGVNTGHSGRITARQLRRSDLLEAFHQVDEEEDINKVTRYFSYEHFYVLYCRFWELDHDRDYRITRDDLLKYGDHSLSHMVVDRIFDAAPRPFEAEPVNRDLLTYESFIYFMLSEEDKSNEVSVRYWFNCVDVDGDGKLNNMEMRSFYAVQLHRMQMTGHEIVPFEDMLCQMMDMIKPAHQEYFVVEDFLQPECRNVSGALFDALFNLNKYLLFEQRDPFMERQKREDEFECDWDRFACIDYNRLAMEEEAREEEAMEIDWVTVDEDDDAAAGGGGADAAGTSGGGFGSPTGGST